jgi:hypothetical protein
METNNEIKPFIRLTERKPNTRKLKRILQREYEFLNKIILKYELAFENFLFNQDYDNEKYIYVFNEMKNLFLNELQTIKSKKYYFMFINEKYFFEKYKPIEK